MRCPRCRAESTHPDYCSSCGARLGERPDVRKADCSRREVSPALLFAAAFIVIHAAAWMLMGSAMSLWRGFGVACGGAFLVGLLAGALRVMNPMDARALGEPLHIPSTVRGRDTPVLVLSGLIGVVATPIAGLLFYLFFAYVKSCLDSRVIAIFGLTIVSGLVLSIPSPASSMLAFRLQSGAMLALMMTGWALSSFFRPLPW